MAPRSALEARPVRGVDFAFFGLFALAFATPIALPVAPLFAALFAPRITFPIAMLVTLS